MKNKTLPPNQKFILKQNKPKPQQL